MTSAPVYCETTLNYARGEDRVAVPVSVHDGRSVLDELDFEACGFTLLRHRTAVRDWNDEAHVSAVHGPEVERLARDFTGCDQAIVYPPLVRSREAARLSADFTPIEFVHSDYTDDYRPMVEDPARPYRAFIQPLLEQAGHSQADIRGAARVAVIQFWRNIGPQQPDFPIAFCDARTTPRDQLDFITVPEYGGQRLEFQTFFARAPDRPADNTWYTFPDMTIDEVAAFRTYDSARANAGRPFWTMHSAFRDPRAGAGAPPRESVEMRVLCLYDEGPP